MTDPRARPLSPIQNQTTPSARSSTVGRPSTGRPSVGAPSAGRSSVGRGRPSVGRKRPSVGTSSLETPPQLVPELSAAAKQALEGKAGTINGVFGKDFLYPSDLRLFKNEQDDRKKWLNDSGINVFGELILDLSMNSDDLPNIYVFQTRFDLGWKLGKIDKVQKWCPAPPNLF